jgi:hypothetical protein
MLRKVTTAIVTVVIALSIVTATFAATQTFTPGTPQLGELSISVIDPATAGPTSGAIRVRQWDGSAWLYTSENSGQAKGSSLCFGSTVSRYDIGGGGATSVWDGNDAELNAVLNTRTLNGPTVYQIVSQWDLGGGMTVDQVIDYDRTNINFYTITWTITNNTGSNQDNLSFIHGADSLLQGTDAGDGFTSTDGSYLEIGVTSPVTGQRMWLHSDNTMWGNTSGANAGSTLATVTRTDVDNCDLTPTAIDGTYDNAYAMQWFYDDGEGGSTLLDGASWTFAATEYFVLPNNVPVATDDGVYFFLHDTINNGVMPSVLDNDTDVQDDPAGPDTLTAVLDTAPAHVSIDGSFTLYSDGTFDYEPDSGYVGVDSFTYHVNDGTNDSNIATASIEVTNQAPTADDDGAYSTHHGTALNVPAPGVLDGDADLDGDTISLSLDTNPAHAASFTLYANGSFDYTPVAGYVGPDSFTYHVTDGVADSNIATVSIDVTNTVPTAGDDDYTVHHSTTLAVVPPGVLFDDADTDSDPLTAVLDTLPAHAASFTFNSDGSFSYTPVAGYVGYDWFTYHVNDGAEDSAVALVSIDVTNTLPVAVNDGTYSVLHNQTLTVPALTGLLANDSDADGDTLTIVSIDASGTALGTLAITTATGAFTYTPPLNYVGTTTFTYQVYDGAQNSNTATVTIDVTNEAPVATGDYYETNHTATLTTTAGVDGVLENDTDADADPLDAVLVDDVDHGTLTLNADGSFTYIPDGTPGIWDDYFTYYADDGMDMYNTSETVTVQIHLVNTPPVTYLDWYLMMSYDTLSGNVLDNDMDADGDPLTATATWGPYDGSLLDFFSDGSFTYQPDPFTGSILYDEFGYYADDGWDQTNGMVWIDVFQPTQESDITLNYNGWEGYEDKSASNGTYRANNEKGGSFTFAPNYKFKGVTLYTYRGPDQGKVRIFLDGKFLKTVDLYRATPQWGYTIPLTFLNGKHTLRFENLGIPAGKFIRMDKLSVNTNTGKFTLEDTDSAITWGVDLWKTYMNASAMGGSFRQSTKSKARVEHDFFGDRIDWITATGPNLGIAKVIIDGVVVETVDLYSPTQTWQVIKTYAGLGDDFHRIRIEATGLHSSFSTGIGIVVDAFGSYTYDSCAVLAKDATSCFAAPRVPGLAGKR